MGFFSRSRSVPAPDTNGSVDQKSVSETSSVRTPKKEKKKAAKEQQRLSRVSINDGSSEEPVLEERFLPLTLERPPWGSDSDQDYGYLSSERHVVLGLEQAARLVDVVSLELQNRGGLDTPFIFSTLGLDINAGAVKRLIKSFIGTCFVLVGKEKENAERKWRDEAKFANMHELAMCLRWGLARITRVIDGVEVRGLLNWDHYNQWAEQEQGKFLIYLMSVVCEAFLYSSQLSSGAFSRLLTNSTHSPSTHSSHYPFAAGKAYCSQRHIGPHSPHSFTSFRTSHLWSRPFWAAIHSHLHVLPSFG